MQTVNHGITDAQDGVGAIAIALVQGQQAPAAARDQVKAGLQSAGNAFEQISSYGFL